MRDLAALDGRELDVSLNAGEITVLVPDGLNVNVDADMRFAGEISVGDITRGGFDQSVEQHPVHRPRKPERPTINLDVDARVGQITVEELP